jgi:hypothetical protein
MTQLICLVQLLYLKGGKLIKEKEVFEIDEQTAEQYVKGGIAKPAPGSEKKPEPVKVEEPEDGTAQAEGTKEVKKKR